MPYPPDSAWNLPPTERQLYSIRKAWKILGYDYTEKDMPDTRWRARDLLYNELWPKVSALHRKSKVGNYGYVNS